MEEWKRGWMAGIVECDGCPTQNRNKPRLVISNNNLPFLEYIKASTEKYEGRIYPNGSPSNYKDGYNRKQNYQLIYYIPDKVVALLKEIIPYLVSKRDKVLWVIKEWERRSSHM